MSTERTQRGGYESVQLMIQNENAPEQNSAISESRLHASSDQTTTSTLQISVKNQQVVLRQYDSDSELSFESPSDNYDSDIDYNEKDQDDVTHNIENTKPYFDDPNLQNQLRKNIDLEEYIYDDDIINNGRKYRRKMEEIPLTKIKSTFILSEAPNQYRIEACIKTAAKDSVNEDESIKEINESQSDEESETKSPLIMIPCVIDISASSVQDTEKCIEEKNYVRNETNADNIHRLPLIPLNGVNLMHETPD